MNNRSLIILLAFILLFGILFWPTLYSYELVKIDKTEVLVRINRITGKTETFSNGKWFSSSNDAEKPQISLSSEDLSKITGNAGIYEKKLKGSLYNGTNFHLSSLEIIISDKIPSKANELKDGNLESLLEFDPDFKELPKDDKTLLTENYNELIDSCFNNILILNGSSTKNKLDFKTEFIDEPIPVMPQSKLPGRS